MKKTHKKILGFAGLGLVAAVTTAAAVMPSPGAFAMPNSFTDIIQVRIENEESSFDLSSSSPSEITTPNYSFKVDYSNVDDINITLVNKDDQGNVVFSTVLWDTSVGWTSGEKTFDLNLDDYGGHGNFTITGVGEGYGSVPIERILTVKYTEQDEDAGGEDGKDPQIPIDLPEEIVTTVEFNLYNANREQPPLRSFTRTNPGSTETLDLSGLADGVYWLESISKNQHGDVLKTTWERVVIDTDGTGEDLPVVIEDVGEEIGKVVITITDPSGNIVVQETIPNPNPGDVFNIHLPDNLPAGVYTITTQYYDPSDNLIKTVVEQFIKSDTSGQIVVPVDIRVDSVTTIETEIYDENGNLVRVVKADRASGTVEVYDANGHLLFTIPNGYADGKLIIPMDGLETGTYTGIISFKNQYGHLVGNTKRIKIHWVAPAEPVIVPDTGGFLQGLNISREDYLITGGVVFMIIGVVAFGVVKRNRSHKR